MKAEEIAPIDQHAGQEGSLYLGPLETRIAAGPGWLLRRLFQLWGIYAYLDLKWVTSDYKLFLTYYVADAVIHLASVTSTFLLAERFQSLGPWGKPEIVFMLSYSLLVTGLLDSFFGFNIQFISRRLGRGQFDHTLIQPQPIWMALLTDGFTPFTGSGVLLPGIGLMAWTAAQLALPVTAGWIGLLLLNLSGSCVILLAVSFLWGTLAFWAPRAAEEVSTPVIRLLTQLKVFPLDGVGPVLLGGLMTLWPVGFLAWYPSRALLGLDTAPLAMVGTPLAAVVLLTAAGLFFRKGLGHYGRTGSSRYRALGHRS